MTTKPSSALAGFVLACLSLSFTSSLAEQAPKEEVSKPPFEEVFKKQEAEPLALIKADREKGVIELEKVANQLIEDYPEEAMPYVLLNAFSRMTPDEEKSLKVMKRLAALTSSNPDILNLVERAKGELKKRESLGKPLDISFTALGGEKIDLSKMKGKVVIVDFWATWCGPCIAVLPELKEVYQEFNPQGLEIVGISLDSDEGKLKKFTKDNDMPWPQYYDGLGWQNRLAMKFGVGSIPAMWIVDKDGNLADMNAGSDLPGKVKKFLAQE